MSPRSRDRAIFSKLQSLVKTKSKGERLSIARQRLVREFRAVFPLVLTSPKQAIALQRSTSDLDKNDFSALEKPLPVKPENTSVEMSVEEEDGAYQSYTMVRGRKFGSMASNLCSIEGESKDSRNSDVQGQSFGNRGGGWSVICGSRGKTADPADWRRIGAKSFAD